MKTNFKQISRSGIFSFIEQLGHKPYRARQVINWIYKKNAVSIDDMTDLSKSLREILKSKSFISNLNMLQKQVSRDGTQKFLFELQDGETNESVLMSNNRDKFTLCISSQAGCAMRCLFCTTGRLGLKRDLKDYEIVDQVIAAKRIIEQNQGVRSQRPGDRISNIVLMGMGEPFNNLKEVIKALWKITDLMGFPKRKITVSTAGIVPGIRELARTAPNVNLAVSLNATTDEIRNRIMPVNRTYPIKELMKACREFPQAPNRRITFEYVLLDLINDSKEDAGRLIKLLSGIKSKVNLIPYNPVKESFSSKNQKDIALEPKKPAESNVLEFQKVLQKSGIAATIRKSKGADISAACGQLKAKYEVRS